MAQIFTMRFAYFYPDRSRGCYWSGPYDVKAKNLTEAKDILTDVILHQMRDEVGPLFEIRLVEIENTMKPGRAEEYHLCVKKGLENELWRRHIRRAFPDGVPKYRCLDADWTW